MFYPQCSISYWFSKLITASQKWTKKTIIFHEKWNFLKLILLAKDFHDFIMKIITIIKMNIYTFAYSLFLE